MTSDPHIAYILGLQDHSCRYVSKADVQKGAPTQRRNKGTMKEPIGRSDDPSDMAVVALGR